MKTRCDDEIDRDRNSEIYLESLFRVFVFLERVKNFGQLVENSTAEKSLLLDRMEKVPRLYNPHFVRTRHSRTPVSFIISLNYTCTHCNCFVFKKVKPLITAINSS